MVRVADGAEEPDTAAERKPWLGIKPPCIYMLLNFINATMKLCSLLLPIRSICVDMGYIDKTI